MRQFIGAALLVLAGTQGASAATDCTLNGVAFRGLTDVQAQAITAAMGVCSRPTAAAARYGSEGYVMMEGRRLSFIDIAAENPFDLNGKPATLYGYYSYMHEQDAFNSVGFRFDLDVFEGKWLSGLKIMNGTNPKLDVVVHYPAVKIPNEKVSDARRRIYVPLAKAQGGKGLLRMEGTFGVFNNNGNLYFLVKDLEMIQ